MAFQPVPEKQQIDAELSRLIALQAEFFQKGNPTPAEIEEFKQAGKRTRELFAQLAQMKGSMSITDQAIAT
jgi:hypothetical protein